MSKVYMVANGHLDPVWLWRWQEGFSEILATYRSALDRMNEFPQYKFTSACAAYYQWIEKVDPEMFAEIQTRVKEGRWEIVGGWFIQPDCNLPDGESFARHALISQRYFKEKFGVIAKTGYNVDSFGHNASLPKILKESGMDNYIFMRPDVNEKDICADLFAWESDDGSKVKTHRIIKRYDIFEECFDALKEVKEKSVQDGIDYIAMIGIGNHGGGPSTKLLSDIIALDDKDLIFATTNEFFEGVDVEDLPVVKDDLQHHARGCYTAKTSIKQGNRQCENRLVFAERMCVLAQELTGAKYPIEKFNKAWKNVLFNHFHDIMGGCSIKSAYDDASYLHGEALSIADQAINFAATKIAHNINTLKGASMSSFKNKVNSWLWQHDVLGTPFIVFNPHTYKVKMPIKICTTVLKRVTDSNGQEIPFQRVRGEHTDWNGLNYNFIFNAEIEPMGYSVYRLFMQLEQESEFNNGLIATDHSLENNKVKVEFDNVTGDICSFYDKESGKYIIDKPCKAVVLDETHCDTWAHNQVQLGEVVGTFGNAEFKVIEEGQVRVTLRVITRLDNSTLCRDYSLTHDSNVLTVKTKVNMGDRHRCLKFNFPITGDKIRSKVPYGTFDRPLYTGEEPCGSWISDGNICIANDCKHAYDTENGEVRMSILRTAIYADHFGIRDDLCEYMDLDSHEFNYSVYPFTDNASAERNAELLNFGLIGAMDTFHNGALKEDYCGFECDNNDVIFTAIKKNQDMDSTVLRLYEANGKDTAVDFALFGDKVKLNVNHNQIKTVNQNGDELDMMEWKK